MLFEATVAWASVLVLVARHGVDRGTKVMASTTA